MEVSMAFEVFTREFVRSKAPKVTISGLGRFSINNSASAMLKKNPTVESVLLLWDKSTHQIGIEPVKKGDHRSYPLKAYGPKGKSGTGFSAVTFLNFINYDWSQTRSFPAEWTGTMLIFTIPSENVTGKPAAQEGSLGAIRRKDRIKKEE
jgi:hypothetical protein